jgi:hypothetical protein
MPAGRENVGEHYVVVLSLFGVIEEFQAVEVGVAHPEVFRLAAVVGAYVRAAVGGAGVGRIGVQAETGQTALAIFAEAAGDVEWQADVVSFLDGVDYLDYLAEIFVAQDFPFLYVGAAFIHM